MMLRTIYKGVLTVVEKFLCKGALKELLYLANFCLLAEATFSLIFPT